VTARCRFAGKVALVTGAASGIGKEIALQSAREEARVVVVDIDATGGKDTVDRIISEGGSALFVAADVSQRQQVAKAMEATVAEYKGLDVLINNAAIELEATIEETGESDLQRIIENNFYSAFLCSQMAIPLFRERGAGAIINIASVNGLLGIPRHAAYNAAKGGVIALTRQLAVDYGPLGIRVNCICPGEVDTPMTRKKIGLAQIEQHLKPAAERCHLKRVGTPQDIANAVMFLASDEASWITGVILPVDGGFSCGWA
jgi:dihydroanticapsin dehydrogenase